MNFPTKEQAELLLKDAEKRNPGLWIPHSQYTALAARNIAEHCPHLNEEKAYIMGLLHDIGRRYGITDMRHCLDGYHFCMEQGYPEIAKICMTHSFPNKDIREAFGKFHCTDEEIQFIDEYLKSTPYDDYDKLIQLCDALALPTGFSLMEKRMVDVVIRHGTNDFMLPKWKATFQIKAYFEETLHQSVYMLLPGVVQNTFNE